ncbi:MULTISPECIES: helix-turn-helix domain-containing protein [unclassified Moraxella]|uniref:helix-turn-helix domain-containing protein n=1 Tax=unclassified Moraxella TaxID=2685852 RepID=UPI003AF7E54B
MVGKTQNSEKAPNVVAFGNRLREMRRAKGISQEDLALLADIDRSYMGRIERGEFNPTLTKIYQLAKALEVDVVEFFMPKSE